MDLHVPYEQTFASVRADQNDVPHGYFFEEGLTIHQPNCYKGQTATMGPFSWQTYLLTLDDQDSTSDRFCLVLPCRDREGRPDRKWGISWHI